MSRVSTPSRRSRRRRRSAAVVAALVAVVLVAVAAAVAFSLGRAADIVASAPPSAAGTPTPSVAPSPSVTPIPTSTPTLISTPAPLSPAAQPCDGHPTLMSVWAHPDDDIIFGNPAISDAISAGDCVRTVFLTAGDAGKGQGYTSSRELGILRAYNSMRGVSGLWDTDEIVLDTGMHVTRLTPQNDPRLSVVFVRLPDGNITDGGFASTGHATLSKLLDGTIPTLSPTDGGPDVTLAQLSDSLIELAEAWQPSTVLTHIPRGSAFAPGDHPDHSVTGTLVRDALGSLPAVAPGIRYLVGYPSEKLPRNLDGEQLDAKIETYRVYTQQDEVIRCADRSACLGTRRFGEWLQRSYPKSEAELQMG
ncbi:PIG-L family deacetylase [Microbacterium sp. CFBP 8794]|uniref:PIG-L family deacetylase n=1 Tax=Microbacterium sp. CFBP 8794 TaxID=2775269 RepID=UPI001783BD5F|nr:PIG-L family deacetylase [Microbacterium sp. CFBP 8794]MBD8478254.1 PIG-L family deacetylase [Microbacterium sp. CFBP 8794]